MLKVYYLRLSELQDYPDDFFYPYVSEESLGRINGYGCPKVRRTKLLGEMVVRKVAQRLRGGLLTDYEILQGQYGKPYFQHVHPALFFNISHSGDYLVVAFSDQEVGVDIERIGNARMEVARRFFHPVEVDELEGTEEPLRTVLFFRLWSVKESFLKYVGSGLSAPLSGFRVGCGKSGISIVPEGKERVGVQVRECRLDKNYVCYVCAASPERPQVLHF